MEKEWASAEAEMKLKMKLSPRVPQAAVALSEVGRLIGWWLISYRDVR